MDNLAKQVAQQQRLALKVLLPQTCQVYPATGVRTVSPAGTPISQDPDPRQYNGSDDIPCRADLSRAFRPGQLPNQVTTVDEYFIEFPFDFVFEETDRVHLNGERFIIRKTNISSTWNITNEATISRLGANLDV